MKPAHLRRLLATLGYHVAAEKLFVRDETHAKFLAERWLDWANNPNRAPTALQIAGSPIETTLAPPHH